jgi:entericidin B
MTRPLAAIFTFALLALLAACNTIEGAGQDTQAAGKAIERSADRNK